jgi:uncharacterized protein (DUF362 family)
MSLVSLVKIQKNTIESMKQAIHRSIELVGYSFPEKVESVVIKPNLCYYWDYTTGQTTDPKFVVSLIQLIREEISPDAAISIVESDASAMKCRHVFKILGYENLAREQNVKLINLSEEPFDPVTVQVGGQAFNLRIPKLIHGADLRINVPKIKYAMNPVKVTCALKNVFGCNPFPRKFKYHPHLKEVIVALNKAMRFDLIIIDGNVVSGIQPRKLGLVMTSGDPVAADAIAAEITGTKPKTIEYLKLAEKEGLGSLAFVPVGTPLEYFKSRYPGKSIRTKFMGNAYDLVNKLQLSKRLGIV